jgi:hypothetical protein
MTDPEAGPTQLVEAFVDSFAAMDVDTALIRRVASGPVVFPGTAARIHEADAP